jgi:retron-type reverse transcriptase
LCCPVLAIRSTREWEEPISKTKPFSISKQVVWEAYRRVKANQGAAGVDGQSIKDFEAGLKDNLYKIWNRMCSGSYFPPPVRTVGIAKSETPMVTYEADQHWMQSVWFAKGAGSITG